MATPDTEKAPAAPPHLRVAETEGRECDSCTYYKGGHCTAFPPLCVSGEWVCDHYKKGRPDPDEPFQGRTLEEADQEARVRVREHTRGRKKT